MREEDLYEYLKDCCPYSCVCSQSNYGNRWECVHDKLACPIYYDNLQAEIVLFETFGLLEKKILYYSGGGEDEGS